MTFWVRDGDAVLNHGYRCPRALAPVLPVAVASHAPLNAAAVHRSRLQRRRRGLYRLIAPCVPIPERFALRGLVFAVAVLVGATGCRNRPKRTEPPGPLVRTVAIEGNARLDDEEIVEYLNLKPTSPLTLGERSYYLPGLDTIDAERVQDTYASHGMYDARVLSVEVDVRRKNKSVRRQRAHVRIEVDEGRPTHVRNLDFRWIGEFAPSMRRRVEAACRLAAGQPFGIVELNEARKELLDALEGGGFAYAKVDESARVDTAAHLADVTFEIQPGPHKMIGAIEFEGLVQVPHDLVMREVEAAIGKPFTPQRLRQIEAEVYGLGVFATVSVVAGAQTPGPEMSLVVRVTESKMQRIRLGVGIQIDPIRWQQHGTAQYQHHNLFGRLYGFTARAQAGYAELPALYDPQQHGPVAKLGLELRKKGLLERRIVWTEAPGFELGIWEGYQFYSVTNRLAADRFFTRYFELGLSYNNRFTDLFNIQPDLDQNRTVLGLDFRDPYFLAFIQVRPTLHLTDNILEPTNGARLGVNYDLANRYFGGQFNYHRIEPDLRGYYRPHARIQLAARARVGIELPYGKAAAVPIDQKFYLGGSGDIRGWPLRRLSPRLSLCEDPADCRGTPVGGLTMVHGSVEVRVRAVADLWVAAFVDGGDVRAGVLSFSANGWLYTTGGGFRYHSPVGIFRLDVGGQLNQDPRFVEPRRWAIHFGIGEVF